MSVTYRAILPPRKSNFYASRGKEALDNLLRSFASSAEKQLRTYPTAQPWKSRPPTKGLRAGGRRTGAYGKGWVGNSELKSGESITLTNPVKYATYVGGPKQTGNMKNRGWPNVKEVGEKAARDAVKGWMS